MVKQLLLMLTFGAAPGTLAPPIAEPDDGQTCMAVPPAPAILDVSHFDYTKKDGTRLWGAAASYDLSSGDVGEAFFVIGNDGAGEAYLTINGDIIAHAAIVHDEGDSPTQTSWTPLSVTHPPEVIVELMRVDLPPLVADTIPQEFKCSPFGRKVLKAGKYLWTGLLAASGAACCIATQTLACPACAAGAAIGTLAGQEFADGYCD
jgi:hypothetical protein